LAAITPSREISSPVAASGSLTDRMVTRSRTYPSARSTPLEAGAIGELGSSGAGLVISGVMT
jgi:hypothetical protein